MLPLALLYTNETIKNNNESVAFLAIRSLTFIFLFLIILGAAYVTSKYISNKSLTFMNQKNIKVLERVSLGLDKSLFLINLDSKYYLISSTKTKIEVIDKLNTEEISIKEPEVKNNETNLGFENYFKSYLNNHPKIFNSSKPMNRSLNTNLSSKLLEIRKRNIKFKNESIEEEHKGVEQ